MESSLFPHRPGVYTLLLAVTAATSIRVGKLGIHQFPVGHYTYTGSALGARSTTLRHRIHRHLRPTKRLHWHIDYLLAAEAARVQTVLFAETSEPLECPIATAIVGIPGADIVVPGFGASDCRRGCPSHLCCFPQTPYPVLVDRVAAIYHAVSTPRRVEIGAR